MYNHEPEYYDCPFCHEDPRRALRRLEIIHRYDEVIGRLNPKW